MNIRIGICRVVMEPMEPVEPINPLQAMQAMDISVRHYWSKEITGAYIISPTHTVSIIAENPFSCDALRLDSSVIHHLTNPHSLNTSHTTYTTP